MFFSPLLLSLHFFILSVSQPNFTSSQDPRSIPSHWLSFLFCLSHNLILLLIISLHSFFFYVFYQAFDLGQKEACAQIESLEAEVWQLQEHIREGEKFDISLITGTGRGRPKAEGFVRHVRCLLATGLFFLPCFLLI
jgi:hypothetical protein